MRRLHIIASATACLSLIATVIISVQAVIRTVSIALCAGFLAGCSGPAVSPLATFSSPPDGGDTALLSGSLTLENGCLYLTSTETNKRWLPVLRAESGPELRDGNLVFGVGKFAVGSQVGLGGGESGGSDANFRIPSSCDVATMANLERKCRGQMTGRSRYWLTLGALLGATVIVKNVRRGQS